jgi:hypothetical protein
MALAVVILAPLVALSLRFGEANVAIVSGKGRPDALASAANWLFYVRRIPSDYLGWPAAAVALLGAITAAARRNARGASFWAAWAIIFYIFFSIVGLKSSRLVMLWTPGLAYFAGAGMAWLAGRRSRLRMAAAVAAAAVIAVTTYATGWQKAPRAGYAIRDAAGAALAAAPGRILYFGAQNGTFSFRIRELAGVNRPVVVRADKVYYADSVVPELGRIEQAGTPDKVREITAGVAPDVVVIERQPAGYEDLPAAGRYFLDYASSNEFERFGTVHSSKSAGMQPFSLDLYHYKGPRAGRPVDLPMPAVGMTLKLPAGK